MSYALFFLLLGVFFVFAVIYPYLVYPLLLKVLPKQRLTPPSPNSSDLPRSALVFCAYNEQDTLPEKLENLREIKAFMPTLEILAYSDGSSDNTSEILEGASDILTPVISPLRTGKVLGMRKLVEMTDAEVVIFSDANVFITPSNVRRLLSYFSDTEVGCVSAILRYKNDSGDETPTTKVGGAYWKLEEKIKGLESESGSMMGSDGALFARLRQGYPNLPAHSVDDLAVSMSVMFDGRRCISAPDVEAYENLVACSADEFRRKRRIACGAMSTYQYLAPQLAKLPLMDRFKFHSHKTIRWWGGLQMVGALLSFLISAWLFGIGLQVTGFFIAGGGLIWSLGQAGLPVFGTVFEIIKALVATNIGVLENIFGRRYATWSPAKSRQGNISNG